METVIEQVSQYMDDYDVVRASRMLMDFVGELSNWYLRLSRERLKSDDNSEISQVFGYVLYTLAQLFAPFAPFFTELVHKTLVDEDTSVHHSDWPDFDSAFQNEQLEEQMSLVQKVVELGHSARKGKGMKVRQPLPKATIRFSKEVMLFSVSRK